MNKILEVGDTVILNNFMGETKFPITRVTKTQAMSRVNKNHEKKFKREVYRETPEAIPYHAYSTNRYSIAVDV